MVWSILADMVLVLHGFFHRLGGAGCVAVQRRPRLAWAHLPALAWAVDRGHRQPVPLTPLESGLRLARRHGYAAASSTTIWGR